jgi:hypothetical protein
MILGRASSIASKLTSTASRHHLAVGEMTAAKTPHRYAEHMSSVHPQSNAVRLTLLDVDNADVQDIMGALPDGSVSLVPEQLDGTRYGEPGTIALALVVAIPVVRALAAWIVKRRRKQQVDIRARVLHADGSEVELSVNVNLSESESPDAAVIQQLVDGFGLESALAQPPQSDRSGVP